MARKREFTVENGKALVRTQMKDGVLPDGTDRLVPVEYDVPATPADFRAWIMELPDAILSEDDEWTGPLAEAHQAFWSGVDSKIRAKSRENAAAESTIIRVDKKEIDLMLLPVDKAIRAINGVFAVAEATGKEPQGAYAVARRKLVASGTAVENAATGMIERKAA